MTTKGIFHRVYQPALLCISISICLCISGCSRSTSEYNLILIGLDTTRADHISCINKGLASTPHLDKLAAGGILFDRCFTVVPTTLASFTSLMSGLYPHTHGVARNGIPLKTNLYLLPERFRDEKGYETAAFISAFALDSVHGFDQGYDTFSSHFSKQDNLSAKRVERRAASTINSALQWFKNRNNENPFFLFLHLFDPHAAYAPPAPFDEKCPGHYPRWGHHNLKELAKKLQTDPDNMAAYADNAKCMYAREVEYMDMQIGRLLDYLQTSDLLSKTIILVVGDHGEVLTEHAEDYFGHGKTVYDKAIHVPLIVAGPGIPPAKRISAIVRTIDLAPTIADLYRLDKHTPYEGRSLLPLINGQPDPQRPVYSEATKPWDAAYEADPTWKNQLKEKCIRTDQWKLTWQPLHNAWRLYSFTNTNNETVDIYEATLKKNPQLVTQLQDKLFTWASRATAGHGTEMSEDTARKLKALGYTR